MSPYPRDCDVTGCDRPAVKTRVVGGRVVAQLCDQHKANRLRVRDLKPRAQEGGGRK